MLDCAAELRNGIFKSFECDLEKPSAFALFNLVLGAPNMRLRAIVLRAASGARD